MRTVDLTWWLRIVGLLYLAMATVILGPRIPIRTEGPPGVLERAAAGDAIARFAVDSWVMIGLYVGAIGVGLELASRSPQDARALVWAVLIVELVGGIGIDVYKIVRGYKRTPPTVWIVIHSAVIVTGWLSLRLPPTVP